MNLPTGAGDTILPPRFAGWAGLRLASLLLPSLILASSLAVTYLLYLNEQQNTQKDLQRIFDNRVQDFQNRIEQRMQAYEQLLRGADGLFATQEYVSRKEFRAYVERQQLNKNYPGIQGLCFSLAVPPDQKDRHIAAVRKEGFTDYDIWPKERREYYTSAIYLEPFAGRNRRAFGFDNFTEPARRAAMQQARDTGEITLSGKVPLLHEKNERQAAVRMYLPVYKNGAPLASIAERRTNIIGWVYVPFRMDDFMNAALGERKNRLDAEIYDGDEISRAALMYDTDPSNSHTSVESDALFKAVRSFDIHGRHWTMGAHSLPDFDLRMEKGKQHAIAQFGTSLSALLALLTWLVTRSRAKAVQHAREIGRELAERKQAEAGLRLAATVVGAVEEAVLVTDSGNNIVSVNPAFTAITGYAPEEVIGKNPRVFSSGRHAGEFFHRLWQTLLATGTWHGEIWDRRKNGELYVKWLSIRLVRDEDGNIVNHVAVFSDISERKLAEERLQHLAHHDALTGLPNRTLFADRFEQSLAQAKRDNGRVALMFLDLDKFKPVNDTMGHAIGDMLLKEATERLQHCVRASDTVSRIGGDEFVVLLPSVESELDAMRVAEKILHALNRPFSISGQQLQISSSIGVAVYPDHGSDEKTLSRKADAAMYFAKERGGNNVRLYQPKMGD
jgi:diguanylate cyclase (GGDEF)-like protein/PAS domain S-box-containing protein